MDRYLISMDCSCYECHEYNNRRCVECFVTEERPKKSLLCGIAKQKRHQPQQIHIHTYTPIINISIAFVNTMYKYIVHTQRNHIYFIIIISYPLLMFSQCASNQTHGSINIIVTHTDTKQFFFYSLLCFLNKTANHH